MILYRVGCGLGNQLQCLPAFRALCERHGRTAVVQHANAVPNDPRAEYTPFVFPVATTNQHALEAKRSGLIEHTYQSLFSTAHRPPLQENESEVAYNLRIVGAEPKKRYFHGWHRKVKPREKFDVLIASDVGWDPLRREVPAKWYTGWPGVARHLLERGYSVAVVGVTRLGEGWPGVLERTGIGLLATTQLIAGARLVLANDSGLYHLANVLEVPNVAVFFCTSPTKNYDSRFHRTATIVQNPRTPYEVLEVALDRLG